mgnify:FL=1
MPWLTVINPETCFIAGADLNHLPPGYAALYPSSEIYPV